MDEALRRRILIDQYHAICAQLEARQVPFEGLPDQELAQLSVPDLQRIVSAAEKLARNPL